MGVTIYQKAARERSYRIRQLRMMHNFTRFLPFSQDQIAVRDAIDRALIYMGAESAVARSLRIRELLEKGDYQKLPAIEQNKLFDKPFGGDPSKQYKMTDAELPKYLQWYEIPKEIRDKLPKDEIPF